MADAPEPAATGTARNLRAGTRVEVRDRFDGSWTGGFTIEEVGETGVRLRRRSDGEVLPGEFRHDVVRREHKSMWWI